MNDKLTISLFELHKHIPTDEEARLVRKSLYRENRHHLPDSPGQ